MEKKYVVGFDYLDWVEPKTVLLERWFFYHHDSELGVDIVYNPDIDVYCYTDMAEVNRLFDTWEEWHNEP